LLHWVENNVRLGYNSLSGSDVWYVYDAINMIMIYFYASDNNGPFVRCPIRPLTLISHDAISLYVVEGFQ